MNFDPLKHGALLEERVTALGLMDTPISSIPSSAIVILERGGVFAGPFSYGYLSYWSFIATHFGGRKTLTKGIHCRSDLLDLGRDEYCPGYTWIDLERGQRDCRNPLRVYVLLYLEADGAGASTRVDAIRKSLEGNASVAEEAYAEVTLRGEFDWTVPSWRYTGAKGCFRHDPMVREYRIHVGEFDYSSVNICAHLEPGRRLIVRRSGDVVSVIVMRPEGDRVGAEPNCWVHEKCPESLFFESITSLRLREIEEGR